MKTQKMSVKELKGLATFTAISGTGKQASFTVEGDVAVDVETGKQVKLDSIRRSWEVVVEEVAEQMTADEVVVEETQAEEVAQIVAGSTVKLADGTIGTVIDVHNTLATVQIADEEIPASVETLVLTEAQVPAQAPAEAEQTDATAEKPARAKRTGTGKNMKADKYLEMVTTLEPTSIEEKQGSVKKTFEADGITLEYITGVAGQTEWELLRSKKSGSWHGVFFKVNSEILKDVEAGDKKMKDPSKSKGFVKAYLQEKFNTSVEL